MGGVWSQTNWECGTATIGQDVCIPQSRHGIDESVF